MTHCQQHANNFCFVEVFLLTLTRGEKTPPKDAFRALLFFFQYSTAGLQLCNKMHLLILLISFNRMRLYHKNRIFGTIERAFFVRNIYIYIYFRTNLREDLPRTEVSSGSNQMWHKDSYWGLRKIRKHRPRWHLWEQQFVFFFFNFSNPVYTRNNDIKTKEGRV